MISLTRKCATLSTNLNESPRPTLFSRQNRTEERHRADCVDRADHIVRRLRRYSRFSFPAGRLVYGVAETDLAPAFVDIRAGLDDALHNDGGRGLARSTRDQRRRQSTHARFVAVRNPICVEFALDAYFLRITSTASRVYRDLPPVGILAGYSIVVRKDTSAERLSSGPLSRLVYVRSRAERHAMADEFLNGLSDFSTVHADTVTARGIMMPATGSKCMERS
jgi:hypothetical protein